MDRNMGPNARIPVVFTINGKEVSLEVGADETALHVIRDRLLLKGTKEGCGIGECGACTIVVDGKAVNACLMLAAQLQGRNIMTVEGLIEKHELSVLQKAFLEVHAVQCGFCTPGMLMSSCALLKDKPRPDKGDIVDAISGNLCRCTGYQQVVGAIQDAARRLSREKA